MPVRFRRTDRHVYRHIAGEHLLVDLQSKSTAPFFAVTPTAADLWKALEDWQTTETLAERLCAKYGIPGAQAENDVLEFLAQLEQIGGVTRIDEESA